MAATATVIEPASTVMVLPVADPDSGISAEDEIPVAVSSAVPACVQCQVPAPAVLGMSATKVKVTVSEAGTVKLPLKAAVAEGFATVVPYCVPSAFISLALVVVPVEPQAVLPLAI